MLVGYWNNAQDAFPHLEKEAYSPSSTDRKFDHAMKQVAKVGVDVTVAVGTALATPLMVIALPELAAFAGGAAIAGAFELTTTAILEGFKDSKDLPKPSQHLPVLQRGQITSIIHPDKKLSDLAGDRPGTRGPVYLKDLLDGIWPHYVAAKRNWKANSHPLNSCQDAEDLYRMFAETDYHLSKMRAYAKALQEFATAYVTFCDANATKVREVYSKAKDGINKVLDAPEDWHKQHCHVNDHCYRTSKASRLFTKKAA